MVLPVERDPFFARDGRSHEPPADPAPLRTILLASLTLLGQRR